MLFYCLRERVKNLLDLLFILLVVVEEFMVLVNGEGKI